MSIVDLFIFITTSVGVTAGLVVGSLLDKPRQFIAERSDFLGEMIHCPMCTGFWVGAATSLLFDVSPLYGAFMISLFSWVIIQLVDSAMRVGEYYSIDSEDGE